MHECYLDLSFELATHPVVILYCRTVHWLGLPRTQPHYLLRQSPSPSGKDPVLSQSQRMCTAAGALVSTAPFHRCSVLPQDGQLAQLSQLVVTGTPCHGIDIHSPIICSQAFQPTPFTSLQCYFNKKFLIIILL